MPKYRKLPPLSVWKRFRKWTWVVIGAVAIAIVGAIAGATITTDRLDDVAGSVGDLFNGGGPEPTYPEAVADRLFRQTKQAQIWADPPTMYPQSREFLLDHFRELNPLRPHHLLLLKDPVISPDQLAMEMPLYAGSRVTLVGRVRAWNIETFAPSVSKLRPPGGKKPVPISNLIYIAQLGSTFNNRSGGITYVLFTEAAVRRLKLRQWVAVIGVPIAGGSVRLVHGADIAPAAYVLGAAVQPVYGPRAVERYVKKIHEVEQRFDKKHH